MKLMEGIDWGANQIDLRLLTPPTVHMRPIQIHHKDDGATNDGPSFCIVMASGMDNGAPFPPFAYGQFTLKTINEALADIGYEIKRKEKVAPVESTE